MNIIEFGVGMADPSMELLDNGNEGLLTYSFTNFADGYRLDVKELETSLNEFVADSRYPVYGYEIMDYTSEEFADFNVALQVKIKAEGKSEDELYKELWPITNEMNRLDPTDYAL